MAKHGISSTKKTNGIKVVVKKLQKSLLLGKKSSFFAAVPEDVKEGHVAVLAMDCDEPKRFIVPLNYLKQPTFTRLLEQAAEEYGFDREGALTIPCPPCELERILAELWRKEGIDDVSRGNVKRRLSCNPMEQSC